MSDPQQNHLSLAPLAEGSERRDDVLSSPFRVTRSSPRDVAAAWVRAFGELDLAGSAELEIALRDATTSARLVVLDLSELSFIDLVGVRTIVDASARALSEGRRLILAFAPAHVQRLFTLAGVSDAVEMIDLAEPGAPSSPRLRSVNGRVERGESEPAAVLA